MREGGLTMIRVLLLTVFVLMLASCSGKNYWVKPGATDAEFNRDNRECAQLASGNVEEVRVGIGGGFASGGYYKGAKISEAGYRLCMRDRGYVREQHLSPPKHG